MGLFTHFLKNTAPDSFHGYIALGDSISIDDYPGEGKGSASLFYKNQDHLYPEFRGRDLHSVFKGITFRCHAQDGATSYDVLHEQLRKLPRSDPRPSLFTVTAGGNDILALQADAEEICFRLQAIIKQLQERFSNCHILLGTVYDPTDGVGDLFEPGVCLEREMECMRKTNDAIRAMFDSAGVQVVDIHRHFLGHGAHCKDSRNPYYHPEDPSLWYTMNIEPNSRGAHEVRRLFWEALHS